MKMKYKEIELIICHTSALLYINGEFLPALVSFNILYSKDF